VIWDSGTPASTSAPAVKRGYVEMVGRHAEVGRLVDVAVDDGDGEIRGCGHTPLFGVKRAKARAMGDSWRLACHVI